MGPQTFSLSYREVIPDHSSLEEWTEITLNTGATLSTLQDIKIADRAGGYSYKNEELVHNRNRFIYWRTYQDVMELSEISLDFNLYQNKLRYKFAGSPVISVSINEHESIISVLVITVCSLHRINFPHPKTTLKNQSSKTDLLTSNLSTVTDSSDPQSYSIFRESNAILARDPSTFYVFDTQSIINSTTANSVPHCCASLLSRSGDEAYFALAWQAELMLYTMKHSTSQTTARQIQLQNSIPRLFFNLKEVIVGKNDACEEHSITSMVFICVEEAIYLITLYGNSFVRVYSTTTLQCVASINCAREGHNKSDPGEHVNSLRKITNNSICVYLSFDKSSEFFCMDVIAQPNDSLELVRRKVISAPPLDLIDFDVSETRIWALWSNSEGDFSISNYSLISGMGMNWISAAIEPSPVRSSVSVGQSMDPREAYCSYIFHPGKFERTVITKALFMYRRSSVQFDSKHCAMTLIKEHVCQAVEEEIQSETKEFDVSDEEHLEISTRMWERFYSCCEQYHTKSCQPLGVVILNPLGAVCVVKRNTFSLLRPCESLEHLMLSGNKVDVATVIPVHFPDNERAGEDLVNLVAILAQIEKWLSDDVKMDFDKKLYYLEMPNVLIARLADEILSEDQSKTNMPPNFLISIQQSLRANGDLPAAMSLLLDILRMDNGIPEAMHTQVAYSSRVLLTFGTYFGSNIGLSFLSETVRQIVSTRFAICRNLLLLQQILINTNYLSVDVAETLRSHFMPDTVIFLQSYYVMVWISETPVNMNAAAALETSVQRLSLLQLTNGSGRIYSTGGKDLSAPLLRVFLNAKGLYTALSLFVNNIKSSEQLRAQNTLLPLSTIICQLIWPVSFNFVFGEWLFGTCQHIIIADYVRLLNTWCEWNVCSRQFILAVSLLDSGESHKAYNLFLKSSKGVLKEQFLQDKIIDNTPLVNYSDKFSELDINDVTLSNQMIVQYYLKIIDLFKQHNALDRIIAMAQAAVGILKKDDPQLPMFQSIIFNYHLNLGHYDESYNSLINNSDSSRRKDCLRQLVMTLFSNNRSDLLLNFPYVGLHDEFENIVESRARSLSIEHNKIYHFLYAFHTINANWRKASAIMYEQAMRCQLEGDSIELLKKRCSSLAICLNSLNLTEVRDRWIAKPVISDEAYADHQNSTDVEPELVVIEFKDVERELLQAQGYMRLAQQRKDISSFLSAGPQEMVVIMASCGLFTDALNLAKGFDLPLQPIFEILTSAYVRTAEESPNDAWAWLQENDLTGLPYKSEASEMTMMLMRRLIETNEKQDSSQIRKCVVNKFLSLNAFVPQWIMTSYKADNCFELLHCFVKHYRLLEAAELANEIIRGMLGIGSEYFCFKHSISVTSPPLKMPIHVMDILLHGLKENSEIDEEYKEALIELKNILHKYEATATRIANDKKEMALQAEVQRSNMKS